MGHVCQEVEPQALSTPLISTMRASNIYYIQTSRPANQGELYLHTWAPLFPLHTLININQRSSMFVLQRHSKSSKVLLINISHHRRSFNMSQHSSRPYCVSLFHSHSTSSWYWNLFNINQHVHRYIYQHEPTLTNINQHELNQHWQQGLVKPPRSSRRIGALPSEIQQLEQLEK